MELFRYIFSLPFYVANYGLQETYRSVAHILRLLLFLQPQSARVRNAIKLLLPLSCSCAFSLIILSIISLNYTGKTARGGLFDGLSLILYYNDADYGELGLYSDGFKVLLSENDAFPSAHSITKFTPLKQETFLSIQPIETYCSPAVKALSIDQRQCVLPHEFPLKHFKRHVGTNCILECRVQTTLKLCGCITYFFYTNETQERVCSIKDIPCLLANFSRFSVKHKESNHFYINS